MPIPRYTLTITLLDDGTVATHGPLADKLLCWGLLKAAEHQVNAYKPPDSKIVPVGAGMFDVKGEALPNGGLRR